MVLEEHTQIVLTTPIFGDDGEELQPGDVGVIIHTHSGVEAFVVEFLTLNGDTWAIATVAPSQMRQVTDKDIIHTREFAIAA